MRHLQRLRLAHAGAGGSRRRGAAGRPRGRFGVLPVRRLRAVVLAGGQVRGHDGDAARVGADEGGVFCFLGLLWL